MSATWIGHSTAFLQIGGLNVVTDPMWGERASPIGFAGPRRTVRPGVAIDALPPIDIVLVSHNHYDHLDDRSVRRLAAHSPEARWLVPLGLGDFIRERGGGRVSEASWWERIAWAGIRAHAMPAQHFSARSLTDRNRTLWCGWSLEAGGRRIFFAGDSGYHALYSLIGQRFGPFDLSLLPIGAYEPRWFMRSAHMNPEESVRTYLDLGGRGAMLPIHWGTFRLTDEPLDEPRDRILAAWRTAKLREEDLWLLAHGETRQL